MFKAIKKPKRKVLRHFKVDPVLEIDATIIAGWIYVDW